LLHPFGEEMLPIGDSDHHKLGERFAVYFRERKPRPSFTPYDLRHCCARRGMECRLSPDFMAREMGHSLQMHTTVYRAWVGQNAWDAVYDQAMAGLR
jgi:integrase